MGACTVSRLLGTLAAVYFAIAVMAAVSNRAIAATETPSADTSTTSCPHQLDKDGKLLKLPDIGLHCLPGELPLNIERLIEIFRLHEALRQFEAQQKKPAAQAPAR